MIIIIINSFSSLSAIISFLFDLAPYMENLEKKIQFKTNISRIWLKNSEILLNLGKMKTENCSGQKKEGTQKFASWGKICS